jgi:hypothetical protein
VSSARKLQEAAFFIELLHALEERNEPLTNVADAEAEASFLYAAILNAFYSVIEIMRKEGHDSRDFKTRHPEIYADGSKGGERAKTVHIAHIEPSLAGYEPPPGNAVNFRFRSRPRLCPEKPPTLGRVDLQFKPQYYFRIELRGKNVHALEYCDEHLDELRAHHAAKHAT